MELMNSEGEGMKVSTFDIEFWGPFSNRNRTSGPDEMDQESDYDSEASAEYVGYLNEMMLFFYDFRLQLHFFRRILKKK